LASPFISICQVPSASGEIAVTRCVTSLSVIWLWSVTTSPTSTSSVATLRLMIRSPVWMFGSIEPEMTISGWTHPNWPAVHTPPAIAPS
jgi:hypothetical protein